MEINTLYVEELEEEVIEQLKKLGYKEEDMIDIASWETEDGCFMNVILPPKK